MEIWFKTFMNGCNKPFQFNFSPIPFSSVALNDLFTLVTYKVSVSTSFPDFFPIRERERVLLPCPYTNFSRNLTRVGRRRFTGCLARFLVKWLNWTGVAERKKRCKSLWQCCHWLSMTRSNDSYWGHKSHTNPVRFTRHCGCHPGPSCSKPD